MSDAPKTVTKKQTIAVLRPAKGLRNTIWMLVKHGLPCKTTLFGGLSLWMWPDERFMLSRPNVRPGATEIAVVCREAGMAMLRIDPSQCKPVERYGEMGVEWSLITISLSDLVNMPPGGDALQAP